MLRNDLSDFDSWGAAQRGVRSAVRYRNGLRERVTMQKVRLHLGHIFY